jgi:pSer/pThr/pTyr-binding forkhead associated (FHA) protein
MSDQQFQLRVQKGPELGKVYQLTSVSITVGRDPMAEITIADPEVSRQHARLVGTISGYRIQDLGSTNGTFVDDVRLGGEPIELEHGQVITIGSGVALVFQTAVETEDRLETVVDSAQIPFESPQQDKEELEEIEALDVALEEPHPQLLPETDEEGMEFVGESIPDEAGIDNPAIADSAPQLADWEPPLDDEPAIPSEPAIRPGYSDSGKSSDPVVIPHQGASPQSPTDRTISNSRRLSTIIAAVLLLVLCCCCGSVLFMYYYGGDWILRQMGLIP